VEVEVIVEVPGVAVVVEEDVNSHSFSGD